MGEIREESEIQSAWNKMSGFSKTAFVTLTTAAAAGIFYFSIGMPGTSSFDKDKRQREGRLAAEQETERRLIEIQRAVLERAEYSDGMPGFSFQDQANLVKGLGCKLKPIQGGESIIFRREGRSLILRGRDIEGQYMTEDVSEEQARTYLDRK